MKHITFVNYYYWHNFSLPFSRDPDTKKVTSNKIRGVSNKGRMGADNSGNYHK